jgi:imidazolonepropionase-like amidohydrolase
MNMKNILTLSLLAVGGTVLLRASDQIPGAPQQGPIAIVGATIHPVTGPPVEGATLLFENGRISAIGTDIALPPGTQTLDARGKHVYPGLISPDTYIGLTEIGAVRASNDRQEVGNINPNVRAERAFNPESELIPVTRANGILTAISAPSGGLIAGTGAAMMMDGWTWEDMTLKAPVALYVSWPSMSIVRTSWMRVGEDEQKKQRDQHLQELSNAFRDARAYWKAKQAGTSGGIPNHDTDIRWEAMLPVLQRNIPVVVWAYDMQQIQAAVAWADQESVRVVIGGGHDAWRVADLLRTRNIPVLAGGIHRLPSRRFEAYDEPFDLPKKLHDAGVTVAIITQSDAPNERNLPYEAAQAVAFGLPRDEALKAITLTPARIFGIADHVGSLEAGKDATLIITSGDPLEIRCIVEAAFIQGRRVDLSNKQSALYEKYREKYRRMLRDR